MSEEITSFLAELRADRQAVKDKEKRESWTKYTSLSIVCIAVLAAVATQWGAKYSSRTMTSLNEATFNQTEASDQWSFYQAKSIKQSISEGELEQAVSRSDTKAAEALKAKVTRYDKEKAEIIVKAKDFEKKRDDYRAASVQSSRKGGEMGLSVSFFQISIAIASICLVVKKKNLWYVSLVVAALATAQMIYAMVLF